MSATLLLLTAMVGAAPPTPPTTRPRAGAPPATAPATRPRPGARAIELGPRHTSELHGFSIRPPAMLEPAHGGSASRLARWVRRDEDTGAVLWSLDVLKNQHAPSEMPAAEYAKVIARQLARSEQFKVDGTDVTIVARRPAMHFRGVWSGALQLWRRQIWVRLGAEEHLVLDVAGRMDKKTIMDAALTASAKTLRVFDPSAAIAERSKSFARGAAVLAGLDERKLRELLRRDVHYYLVELEGRTVGFIRIIEGLAHRSGERGLWVIRSAALALPEEPTQLVREDLFATADRRFEQWQTVAEVRRGRGGVRTVVEGIKQQGLLLVHTSRPGKPRQTRQITLPEAIRPAYLPAAMGVVLPRLIDRDETGSYGFAVFSSVSKDFQLRTVRVVGPDTVGADGKKVAATRLTDQMAPDAPAGELWVDARGLPIRMRTAEGLITRRSDRAAVTAAFAKELIRLDKLAKEAPPAGK